MMIPPFEMGFWHPFGPHGRESAQHILERKQREIDANGWTLWSFQTRRMLKDWLGEIHRALPETVYVFCSDSRGPVDPPHHPVACTAYQFLDASWMPLPTAIQVPHPFRETHDQASAFVVQRVIHPVDARERPTLEWFAKDGSWRGDKLPTRGEYLIRPGAGAEMRRYRAVLVLRDPYLAVVKR